VVEGGMLKDGIVRRGGGVWDGRFYPKKKEKHINALPGTTKKTKMKRSTKDNIEGKAARSIIWQQREGGRRERYEEERGGSARRAMALVPGNSREIFDWHTSAYSLA